MQVRFILTGLATVVGSFVAGFVVGLYMANDPDEEVNGNGRNSSTEAAIS